MKSIVINGFKKSGLKEKLLWTGALIIVICFTVFITIFSMNKGNNSIKNRLINELGNMNISNVDTSQENSKMTVVVNFNNDTVFKNNILFMQLCMSLKDEINNNNKYKNIKEVEVDCSYGKDRVITLTCDDISKSNFEGKNEQGVFSIGMLEDNT